MRLQDRVIIVTGGGHGIGRAYCLRLAQEGASIVVAEIDEPAAQSVARQVEALGRPALALRTDVADEASTQAMARATVERFGRIDALITNAAVFATIPINRGYIEDISVEEFDRVMAVNVRGVFLSCRAVLPYMKAQRAGKIINIASSVVFGGPPGRIHYNASKGAIVAFTRTLAREVGEYNITVNALAPGGTLSEEHPTEEIIRMRESQIRQRALRRVQVPEDLVGTMAFLCSSDADFITGQTIVVDGGNVLH
ncbi:MAG: 3-oxoacyl-ACP reductase FabG [Chloroflexi bacterium]|jgi:3-oxoacyl-[acyl-carrier protein] reductase|nr:3-oxoacyl-ACP reductase FabG [Chloroflexota bacterium]